MSYMEGKDMLVLPDGSTYHLGAKNGEVHPRIITVGSKSRAEAISKLFDDQSKVQKIESSRQMYIFNGTFDGVPMSVIAIGMGSPMMDFMVREASYVCPKEMAIIRLGTCGIFAQGVPTGTVLTAGKGSIYVHHNYGYFDGALDEGSKATGAYLFTKPVPGDAKLNSFLSEQLKKGKVPTHDGLNACGETFYACQGRSHAHFKDENEHIIDTLLKAGVDFVEMETHQLFTLARRRKIPCAAAACAIGIVNRTNDGKNVTADELHRLETEAGRACLAALRDFPLN